MPQRSGADQLSLVGDGVEAEGFSADLGIGADAGKGFNSSRRVKKVLAAERRARRFWLRSRRLITTPSKGRFISRNLFSASPTASRSVMPAAQTRTPHEMFLAMMRLSGQLRIGGATRMIRS